MTGSDHYSHMSSILFQTKQVYKARIVIATGGIVGWSSRSLTTPVLTTYILIFEYHDRPVIMKEAVPNCGQWPVIMDFRMVGTDTLFVHQMRGMSVYNSKPSIESYKIDTQEGRYIWLWRVEKHFAVYNVNGEHLILCEKEFNNSRSGYYFQNKF